MAKQKSGPSNLPEITREQLLEAIAEGFARGVLDLAKNISGMPGTDFYDSVQEGVRAGIRDLVMVHTNAAHPGAAFCDAVAKGIRDGVLAALKVQLDGTLTVQVARINTEIQP